MDKIYDDFRKLAIEYKLQYFEMNELWNIIEPICSHKEFQKRCKAPFYHHDDKMLGEHILRDTIVTYKISQKKNKKNKKVDIKTACIIAMFHDLYECPWQNFPYQKKLFNKHGFTHPLEAAINAITWYPEYFKDELQSKIIVDGIIHHMYPLPVRAIDGTKMDLNNEEKYKNLPEHYKNMIKQSTSTSKIGKISVRKSRYLEGRILSKADKKEAFKKEMHSLSGYLAFYKGKNKKLENK